MEIESKEREKGIFHVTVVGSIVNLLLVFLKFIAGIFGRSSAMVADAVHSLSDLLTDLIVIVLVRVSNKPQDEDHDYGHGKYETFATVIIGLILAGVGVGIAYSGISKIVMFYRGDELPVPGWVALIAALVSIVSKEIVFQYTLREGKRLKSDAVIANGWHHRSDAFSSIGTAVGIGGALLLGPKWVVLDPIAAVLVSVLILITAWQLMKPAMDELMERSLDDETEREITDRVMVFEGVSDLHNLRTRKIGTCYAIEFHLRMPASTTLCESHEVVTLIEQSLKEKYGSGTHIIIHMEPEKFDCEAER